MSGISVSANKDSSGTAVMLKIQGAMFELNMWMRADEISMLERVPEADWIKQGSVQIGRSGDAAAFWSSNIEHLFILIGHDDETWHFGVTLPRDSLATIMAAVRAE